MTNAPSWTPGRAFHRPPRLDRRAALPTNGPRSKGALSRWALPRSTTGRSAPGAGPAGGGGLASTRLVIPRSAARRESEVADTRDRLPRVQGNSERSGEGIEPSRVG